MEEDVLMRTAVRRAPEGTWRRGRPKTIWRRTAEAEMRDLVHRRGTIELVSCFFKPSQPERIISRLGETFIKRCIVERTSTAELRPEKKKQIEKAESCRENLWNEIQLKGLKDRDKRRKRIKKKKKEWKSDWSMSLTSTATSPPSKGEPLGTTERLVKDRTACRNYGAAVNTNGRLK